VGNKSLSIKRLRTELAEVGKEIDQRIVRLDELSDEIKQGYAEFETALEDKQALAEAKFRNSLMSSGDEVWHFAWDNVWNAVKELQLKATTETKHNYQELEPALRAKQSSLNAQLQVSEMWGDQVWTEVWTSVWKVVGGVNDEYRRAATSEIEKVGEELQTLLDRQLVLQTELDELLKSGSRLYSFIKRVTNSVVKGRSS